MAESRRRRRVFLLAATSESAAQRGCLPFKPIATLPVLGLFLVSFNAVELFSEQLHSVKIKKKSKKKNNQQHKAAFKAFISVYQMTARD